MKARAAPVQKPWWKRISCSNIYNLKLRMARAGIVTTTLGLEALSIWMIVDAISSGSLRPGSSRCENIGENGYIMADWECAGRRIEISFGAIGALLIQLGGGYTLYQIR